MTRLIIMAAIMTALSLTLMAAAARFAPPRWRDPLTAAAGVPAMLSILALMVLTALTLGLGR
ncbi:hypothetical protein [Bifidobacterium myosotis]|uniref:Uncharacterized protein n=1 Tax=Bifidobacterium myosotis TaxID=1630166 RepID=A0A5M9ZGD6_9BIFI|nr:hypothetical protein [Bifidobacterium myosotis]KAA8825375.1 hypothetical protein EMO91_12485 [Bifidobacterium myosotis]